MPLKCVILHLNKSVYIALLLGVPRKPCFDTLQNCVFPKKIVIYRSYSNGNDVPCRKIIQFWLVPKYSCTFTMVAY